VVEKVEVVSADIEELFSPETHVNTVPANMIVVDLYKVGHETVTRELWTNTAGERHHQGFI
jgi:hypothetical protein